MADIKVDQVIEFQKLFLNKMRADHQDVLDALGEGKVAADAESVMKKEAAEICSMLAAKA